MNITDQALKELRKQLPRYHAEADLMASRVALIMYDEWTNHPEPATAQHHAWDVALDRLAHTEGISELYITSAEAAHDNLMADTEQRAFLVGFLTAWQMGRGAPTA